METFELYVVNKNLAFTDVLDLQQHTYLKVMHISNTNLVDIIAFYRTGTEVAENIVHKETVKIWLQYGNIVPVNNQSFVMGENTDAAVMDYIGFGENNILPKSNDEYTEMEQVLHNSKHGCYGGIVLFPKEVYVTPVCDSLEEIGKIIHKTIKQNNNYWIFKAPEPAIKRLKLLFSKLFFIQPYFHKKRF